MQRIFRRLVFGRPKDVKDEGALPKLTLAALLAWVGLGADGLSSTAYGPDEAFRALGGHTSLAVFLAVAVAFTVIVISYGYTRIIEHFPSGGGGYVVASKLLGPRAGVVSGAALLVDYVLTITISIASGADAILSFLPPSWQHQMMLGRPPKMWITGLGLVTLTFMNLRGVKESVRALVPIFAIFVATHVAAILVAIGGHFDAVPAVTHEIRSDMRFTVQELTLFGTIKLFMRAYSLGGGTYTGIEAVSNGVGLMREPRVLTAKRTMALMAGSLSFMAGGILLSYLLTGSAPTPGKTMNAVMFERVASGWSLGGHDLGLPFVLTALLSEGAILFVAAQTGFVDGPRVMANMATDSWLPHRFSALSEQLSMQNGVLLMSVSSFAALVYTRGDVSKLVVMYSINVFLTFSLSNLAMIRYWIQNRDTHPDYWRHLPAHVIALVLCVLILTVTTVEKFSHGGWVTLLTTSVVVAVCSIIRRHYQRVSLALRRLDQDLPAPEEIEAAVVAAPPSPGCTPAPEDPVAILFVGGYGGLGRHALFTLLRMFPQHFKSVIFVTVAVVDSGVFKGADEMRALERRAREVLARYERFARSLGLCASSRYAIGTEVTVEAERIATELYQHFPRALVVAGQLIFREDSVYNRILHNETAFLIQRRLQRHGIPMVVLPVRVNLRERRVERPDRYGGAPSGAAP
jgi:amino acid transporter